MSNDILSKTCLMCNVVFHKPKVTSIKSWLKREYCSRRCVMLMRKGRLPKNNRPQPDSTPISYIEAAIVKMLRRGASVKRIAEKLNVSDSIILKVRLKAGFP